MAGLILLILASCNDSGCSYLLYYSRHCIFH